jgi:hypothetical protein
MWDLKVEAIPIFNGEHDAGVINNFEETITSCGEIMGRLEDDQLKIAIIESKLGQVAKTC